MAKEIDWDKFTFRCSSLGYIMSEVKGKTNAQKYEDTKVRLEANYIKADSTKNKATATYTKLLETIKKQEADLDFYESIKDIPQLSESCKTHLCDVYVSNVYGRNEDILSKYLEKGLQMEEDAISLYCFVTGAFHKKNTVRIKGEYFEGELDFEDDDCVYDTKVNWSIFQFWRVRSKPIKKHYKCQLQGYMKLFKKQKARLINALVDTPEHLIAKEEKRLLFDFVGSEEDWNLAKVELRANHTYTDIPQEERLYVVEINRDDAFIEKMEQRVRDCRWYLNALGRSNFNPSPLSQESSDDEEENED